MHANNTQQDSQGALLAERAHELHAANCCVLPLLSWQDKHNESWGNYNNETGQANRDKALAYTLQEIKTGKADGLLVVLGQASDHLYAIETDRAAVEASPNHRRQIREALQDTDRGLASSLYDVGWVESTPSGGFRFLFRTSNGYELPKDAAFANGAETLNGLVVVAPTPARPDHIKRGLSEPYQRVSGTPKTVVFLQQAEVARVKDAFAQVLGRKLEAPRVAAADGFTQPTSPRNPTVSVDYCKTFGWRSELERHGWRYLMTNEHGDRYGHPTDKDKKATAAVVVGNDRDGTLQVLHANVPGLAAGNYQLDQFMAAVQFGGDLSAAQAFMSAAVSRHRQPAGVVTRIAEPAVSDPKADCEDWSWFGIGEPPNAVKPTALVRADGYGLAYHDGCANMVFGDPGSGKSWLMAHEMAKALQAGRNTLFLQLDHEHPRVMRDRLYKLGVAAEILRDLDRCRYVRVQDPDHLRRVHQWVDDFDPRVVVVDSLNGLMELDGGDTNAVESVNRVWANYLVPLTQSDSRGLFILDHLPKKTASKRNDSAPVGSSRKAAMIRGSGNRIDVSAPFKIGSAGQARLILTKDNFGEVSAVAGHKGFVGTFELDAKLDAPGQLEPNTVFSRILPPPVDMGDQQLAERMHGITEHLRLAGYQSKTQIGGAVGRGNITDRALDSLVMNGYVATQTRHGKKGAQTHDYVLVKPYPHPLVVSAGNSTPDWGGSDYD